MKLSSRHFVAAVALHLAVFGLLFSGVQCGRVPEPVNIIQGQLISAKELPKPQAEPKAPPTPEPPAPEPETPKANPEPPKPDPQEVLREKKAEEAKAAEAKREQEVKAAEQKAAQDALLKKQAAEIADKKRLAEEAKKKKEAENAKREEELARAAIEEEEKRLQADKKNKAEQAKRDAEAKRVREAELAAALGAEAEQRSAQEISLWATQLTAAIQRVWTRPSTVDNNLKCVINMQLSATGEVLSASIRTPSGNSLFDESVLRAVYKASPMPLPRDPTVFKPGINITFVPR